MKRILLYLKPYRWRMLVGFVIKAIGTMAELILPMILTHILDRVIVTTEVARIVRYGILMLLFSVVACVGNVVANRMAARVTSEFSKAMRSDLFRKTLYLSATDTDHFTVPSLESRITTDTYNVHNFIGMMQRLGVRAPMLLIGGTVLTLWMDSALALCMLATMPLIFLIVYGISRKGIPLYTEVQRRTDAMIRVAREDIGGIRVIKALSKNEHENRRYDAVNTALTKQERRAGAVMSVANPVMTLMMNLGIAAVVTVAAFRVSNGTSSAATVIAFMQYFTLISMAMMSLSRMFVMYTKCAASASRIAQVLDTPDDFTVTPCETDGADEHIRFDRVSFAYRDGTAVLKDISFVLCRGEHLGIIGATGSGKSTILKLLLRFYEPQEGEIRLGGKRLDAYSREELTSKIGVALQNDFLYAGTIEENIRFERALTHEQIVRAAEIAQAHDFITAMPDGYAHRLSPRGTNLSGGQKQRLLIARALAADPEILILDDSSSALDYKTDASLRRALATHRQHTTVITVAQRVSSVKHCDHIVVVENGRILGSGTHEELVTRCEEYRELLQSQMGGGDLGE